MSELIELMEMSVLLKRGMIVETSGPGMGVGIERHGPGIWLDGDNLYDC